LMPGKLNVHCIKSVPLGYTVEFGTV